MCGSAHTCTIYQTGLNGATSCTRFCQIFEEMLSGTSLYNLSRTSCPMTGGHWLTQSGAAIEINPIADQMWASDVGKKAAGKTVCLTHTIHTWHVNCCVATTKIRVVKHSCVLKAGSTHKSQPLSEKTSAVAVQVTIVFQVLAIIGLRRKNLGLMVLALLWLLILLVATIRVLVA
mgnify:CR=1 FL=1